MAVVVFSRVNSLILLEDNPPNIEYGEYTGNIQGWMGKEMTYLLVIVV